MFVLHVGKKMLEEGARQGCVVRTENLVLGEPDQNVEPLAITVQLTRVVITQSTLLCLVNCDSCVDHHIGTNLSGASSHLDKVAQTVIAL